jgi:hypothetical protein
LISENILSLDEHCAYYFLWDKVLRNNLAELSSDGQLNTGQRVLQGLLQLGDTASACVSCVRNGALDKKSQR